MKSCITDTLSREAIDLAESWQKRANALLSPEERAIQEMMMRLLSSPMDKVILTKMMDQGFRSGNYGRVADQINDLMRTHGIPGFFRVSEKLLMRLFLSIHNHVRHPGNFVVGGIHDAGPHNFTGKHHSL